MSIVGWIWNRRKVEAVSGCVQAEVISSLARGFECAPRSRIFVVMVGLTQSGKTTFADNHPQLYRFARVNSAVTHQALNGRLGHWNLDQSDRSSGYDSRHNLEQRIRLELLERAFQSGVAVVDDSCNLRRGWRRRIIALARSYGYRTALIWMDWSEHLLLERVCSLSAESNGSWPAWTLWALQNQYHDRPYDSPEADECHHVLNGFCVRPISFRLT